MGIRCHQHASGARLDEALATRRSRGGATAKIPLSCDADGYPLDFRVTGLKSMTGKLPVKYLIKKIGGI